MSVRRVPAEALARLGVVSCAGTEATLEALAVAVVRLVAVVARIAVARLEAASVALRGALAAPEGRRDGGGGGEADGHSEDDGETHAYFVRVNTLNKKILEYRTGEQSLRCRHLGAGPEYYIATSRSPRFHSDNERQIKSNTS